MLTTNIVNLDEVAPHIRGVMDSTPRNLFVEGEGDVPLDIGEGVNCSKPSTIGYMMSLLKGKGTCLEIGTGCGWQTAMLSQNYDVITIEINEQLYKKAKHNLKDYDVTMLLGDGFKAGGTFDNIIVCCAVSDIFPLLDKLNNNGILVAPVVNYPKDVLHQITKQGNDYKVIADKTCKFTKAL